MRSGRDRDIQASLHAATPVHPTGGWAVIWFHRRGNHRDVYRGHVHPSDLQVRRDPFRSFFSLEGRLLGYNGSTRLSYVQLARLPPPLSLGKGA
jgi:hypothetical protein